jgi:hypothetical protein
MLSNKFIYQKTWLDYIIRSQILTFKISMVNPVTILINLDLCQTGKKPLSNVTNPVISVDTSPIPAKMQDSCLLISNHRIIMENTQGINLTPEAAIAVKTLLKDQSLEKHSLRIFIAGVG